MKILIANPGSTSYKCKLYNTEDMSVLFSAVVEKIGYDEGIYTYMFADEEGFTSKIKIPDCYNAIKLTVDSLQTKYSMDSIDAVGFKTVVAKGISGCTELTGEVVEAMEDYRLLAPVHTDVYITAINSFKALMPSTVLAGLFETHFHKNIPPEAFMYGIPYELYEKHGIRKYGFHGASHRYISTRAKELYNADKVISCHLGGSSSVCAIKNGWSVDVSMGMSPQSGLLNAKRVGDLDSYALLYLMEKEQLTVKEASDLLMTKGGLYGISGSSGDFRDIEEKMSEGDSRAELAFKTFAYYVKRYIGEYLAILNGTEIIVFTAGAGQKSSRLRAQILAGMENLGIIVSQARNSSNPVEGLISSEDSAVKIAVIPTDEESVVASEVAGYIQNKILCNNK